ncbi:CDP-alcohol phosphatidyltransferase family protein [Candidatus Parcubacteria bacterium]|nr:CDP-alcohol phosphatidyltransferase family protein [Patescibacteria group bacterium]MBU4309168.1 CDP-alcohol phosphatidyltransferase family protein [Patescibacteria group bacterium]MBU4432691.1 CDP-alcohol phosphatidyltransferase family protein [Patescibacteria group bacterium]MBU4577529.1 CDP-alcohol phosphatidyltransferase family protein [Patescibacteria group bacterium]MCG2697216.1 CDP-alcohol phosphatidyltransferase family protein [Candidatus Parcubacteria bacterium]
MTLTYWVVYSILFWGIVVLRFGEKLKDEKFRDLIKNNPNWQRWLHPNSICTFRLLLAWLASSIFIDYECQRTGVFLFTFAAYLDGVDGMVARACDLETEFGKWYDPFCDKLSYFRPLFHFWQIDVIACNMLWVVLFLGSDLLGQFVVRYIQKYMGWSTAANMFGKVKTVLAFALIIYAPILMDNENVHNFAGELFRVVAILAFVSAITKIIPKSKYVRSVIVAKLLCSLCAIYLARNQPSAIFWPILISVALIDGLSIRVPIINFMALKKVLVKIPKSVFVLFASFIFMVLAFSLNIDDAIFFSGCMVTMTTFFLILGRLRVA